MKLDFYAWMMIVLVVLAVAILGIVIAILVTVSHHDSSLLERMFEEYLQQGAYQ